MVLLRSESKEMDYSFSLCNVLSVGLAIVSGIVYSTRGIAAPAWNTEGLAFTAANIFVQDILTSLLGRGPSEPTETTSCRWATLWPSSHYVTSNITAILFKAILLSILLVVIHPRDRLWNELIRCSKGESKGADLWVGSSLPPRER